MTKHYATTKNVQVESASIPGLMDEITVDFFEIDGSIYNINVDANAPAGEPSVFIDFNGKTPVQSELLGFYANNLCFDSVEVASQETGLPMSGGYIHPEFLQFVELPYQG